MKRILIQLDTDPFPSVFDRVVAADAGVDELFSYGSVTVDNVEPLVHGAMFTRGPTDLKHTAIFVGGSDVAAGEKLLKRIGNVFFGPVRVSVMMDSNGSNTTAAAAVLVAGRHLDLSNSEALVLGGTGPVGYRAVQLLAQQGVRVRVGSRSAERARTTCDSIIKEQDGAVVAPFPTDSPQSLQGACEGVDLILAAGAAGAELLSATERERLKALQVAVDLNAVPPTGLAGIEVTDKARDRNGVVCYGAIGVGGTKMKIHRAALQRLFEANDHILDTTAIYSIGKNLI